MGTQYETFDGMQYAFNDMGSKYTIIEPAPDNTDYRANFTIATQSNTESLINENDESAYINLPKMIFISYNGNDIILKATSIGLGSSPTSVYINGIDYTTKLPYIDENSNIVIRKLTNIFTGFQIGSHISLNFDGSKSFFITVSNVLKNKVRNKFFILILVLINNSI